MDRYVAVAWCEAVAETLSLKQGARPRAVGKLCGINQSKTFGNSDSCRCMNLNEFDIFLDTVENESCIKIRSQ